VAAHLMHADVGEPLERRWPETCLSTRIETSEKCLRESFSLRSQDFFQCAICRRSQAKHCMVSRNRNGTGLATGMVLNAAQRTLN
jgi:hypothetical protein